MPPKIALYWLSNSRAQRILWLLEELGIPYDLQKFNRDPTMGFAPPEMKALNPYGGSPFIKVEEEDGTSFILGESGAIVQFLTEQFADGKFAVSSKAGPKAYANYLQWLHWAEGTAMAPPTTIIMLYYLGRMGSPETSAVVSAAVDGFKTALLIPRTLHYFEQVEKELATHPFLVGDSHWGGHSPGFSRRYPQGPRGVREVLAHRCVVREDPCETGAPAGGGEGGRVNPGAWM